MAESHDDPFATAKDNLRDIVKWLATIFAALAAVVVAGASLTGFSALSGSHLLWALVGGGGALICIFLAIGASLSILTAESFYLGQLAQDAALMATLEQHAADILPPEFDTIQSLLDKRREAMRVAFERKNRPGDQEYAAASKFLLDVAGPLKRLVNLAHFELLRRRFSSAKPKLFALAIAALVGLGVFAAFAGAADSSPENANERAVELDVGSGWSNAAAAFAAACGAAEVHTARLVRHADRDWVSVRLNDPDRCDGVVVTVPASVVVRPASVAVSP